MRTLDRLRTLLPRAASEAIEALDGALFEVRLRAGRPVQLRHAAGEALCGPPVSPEALGAVLASLMDYSLYAREEELRQGFFTLEDGCRVGVCGRVAVEGGRVAAMTAIGSACIRVAREVRGCADGLWDVVFDPETGRVRSALLASPPGMGKTTMLRELARRLSEAGRCVGIADERHELAACRDGVPTLDVGPRTDVMDGCPKRIAIRQMLRAGAPEVIVADEIGDPRDADALADAARCGVAILASAHASSLDALAERAGIGEAVGRGVFALGALLGGNGRIRELREF